MLLCVKLIMQEKVSQASGKSFTPLIHAFRIPCPIHAHARYVESSQGVRIPRIFHAIRDKRYEEVGGIEEEDLRYMVVG